MRGCPKTRNAGNPDKKARNPKTWNDLFCVHLFQDKYVEICYIFGKLEVCYKLPITPRVSELSCQFRYKVTNFGLTELRNLGS